MKESQDLKAGDTVEFQADGKTLILEPIPYGRLKKVLTMVMEAIQDVSKGKDMDKDEIGKVMPNILMDHAAKILPLLFDLRKHPYLTDVWLENNMTIPLVTDVIKKAIIINGLTDFFGKLGAQPTAPQVERPLSETPVSTPATPLEPSGRTTSSV
jgi:hypothetical protein